MCFLFVADLHFRVEMYKRRNRAAKERETEREKMCFLFVADLHLSVEMY